jgi:phosphoribosyl-AMP cyclohydrolase
MQTLALTDLENEVSYNSHGLVAVIAQDAMTKTVLMMAWMNKEALSITLATKDVTYFSRSRQKLWRKGETSGHTQKLVDAKLDCDGDTLLLMVEQIGAACHTGESNCFFRSITA